MNFAEDKKLCDWGPATHPEAEHLVQYECTSCGTFKIIALCFNCWGHLKYWEEEKTEIFCLSCVPPKKQFVGFLYTHIGRV